MRPGAELAAGWGAKLINVYLKTAAYVGALGREGLRNALHPPLDTRLRDRLVECFPEIRDVNFQSITAIGTYEEYRKVIDGCRAAAEVLGCSLFEVEQLWSTGESPGPALSGTPRLLDEVCDVDLDAIDIELPRGFGRD